MKEMPTLDQVRNWLRWVATERVGSDFERYSAHRLLEMLAVNPRTALPAEKV